MEISIVYWLYRDESFPLRSYRAEHVNAQLPMLKRHCHVPYRVVCVTDDPEGLDPAIEVVPIPVDTDGDVESIDPRFPRCYRRLWNWSQEAKILGERIFALDIDSVITDEITPLLEREEDLVVWQGRFGLILGGAYLLRTGTFSHVWERFDFATSPQELAHAGRAQSDQGWLNHVLRPLPPSVGVWTEKDGLCLESIKPSKECPAGARIVSFGGLYKPWMPEAQQRHPWIESHWRATNSG